MPSRLEDSWMPSLALQKGQISKCGWTSEPERSRRTKDMERRNIFSLGDGILFKVMTFIKQSLPWGTAPGAPEICPSQAESSCNKHWKWLLVTVNSPWPEASEVNRVP